MNARERVMTAHIKRRELLPVVGSAQAAGLHDYLMEPVEWPPLKRASAGFLQTGADH
jgi:hypothetical protein